MLVLDASAAVELLLDTARGRRVGAELLAGGPAAAPELLDVEVCSALARLERAGTLSPAEADGLVAELMALPVERLTHELVMPAAWLLRGRVSVADAFYVACVPLVGGPLLTCDGRLGRAALPGLTVTVVQ